MIAGGLGLDPMEESGVRPSLPPMVQAGVGRHWRDRMVDGLAERGAVADRRVMKSLRAVPRHVFVPEIPAEQAYEDRAVVTKFEDGRPSSSASQPSIPLDGSRRHRETTILLGDRGLAALDRTDRNEPPTPDPGRAWPLTARGFGTATSQIGSLVELVRAWDAAGRPTTGAVRIAAYKGPDHPAVPPRSLVERARHTTFVATT